MCIILLQFKKKTDLFKVELFMQTQQQQHGGDRNVTGNSISANSLPSSPKYPIRIFRKTKMPMARNLKDKQSVVRSKQYMSMCNYDKALAMLTSHCVE